MDDFMRLFLALDYKNRCDAEGEEAELDADHLDELDFDHEGLHFYYDDEEPDFEDEVSEYGSETW